MVISMESWDITKKGKVYTVIFDEITYMLHTEQLSILLRYVYDGNIFERFILFVNAYKSIKDDDIISGELKLIGQAIGHIVLNILKISD